MSRLILDGQKIQYHLDSVKFWMDGKKRPPITIDISLSRSCTYNCLYCYGKIQSHKIERQISKKTIIGFLRYAADIGVKSVRFVGDGESTCSPHIYDAILYGKAQGLDMALGTNGYLLKDSKLSEMLPALTYLRFNISAADPKRYSDIHGCKEECFSKVIKTIKNCVEIKRKKKLDVTLGMQMVLITDFLDQVVPLAKLGRKLGVDYLVIKHCSDDEFGSLGINYSEYKKPKIMKVLKEAESCSTKNYAVKVKWSKILSNGKRSYSRCFGPRFMLQVSGSGLVAPCGMLFNDRYKKFHIGNIIDKPFREIWQSRRYWEVMNLISSRSFNAKKDCGCLCLQHKINEFLWEVKKGNINLEKLKGKKELPKHINFI